MMLRLALVVAFVACRKAEPPAPRASDAALVDAAAVDSALVDAALDAAPLDAAAPPGDAAPPDAPPRKKPATKKRSRREACLEACEKRNMYTDCADADGMTGCPCNCP